MRLTTRCVDLLKLLDVARWLTTGQIHRRFFRHASADAVRKRLRKLVAAKYIRSVRQGLMTPALFTLGPAGKRALQSAGPLERKLPAQTQHLLGINTIRIEAELTESVEFFFACWELPGVGWRYEVIPDAVLRLGTRHYAIEFDRGLEGVGFFVRTKMSVYRRGFMDFPLSALIVVADDHARMLSLAKAIGDENGAVLFTTLEAITTCGFLAPIFYVPPDRWAERLDEQLSSRTLSSTREISGNNPIHINNIPSSGEGLLRKGKDNEQSNPR